jgi:phage protein U
MQVGSFGDFVFKSGEGDGNVTFNGLKYTQNARLASHATLEELPVVEMLGLDSKTVVLSGVLSAEFSGDLQKIVNNILKLQDGTPRALVRGLHSYGLYVVQSVEISEDAWCGSNLERCSWTMRLIQTRG